ncbi:hypothetical protein [Immundisolibacter sp.]|uniref:hypothetical protein n=1 Tax=Immundisolibacter sp. TaxID=1934948 RepID=UPI00356B0929
MLVAYALPVMKVDSQTYEVPADGTLLTCEPAKVLPLAQRYFLFWVIGAAALCVDRRRLLQERASRSTSSLWLLVRDQYKELTGEVPAASEQGEIILVVALFCGGQLRRVSAA